MKIAVLGTGVVGAAIGSRLIELGHEVKMGSRTPDNEKAQTWAAKQNKNASHGAFADAAAFAGEFIFNCTQGVASLDVLKQAGEMNLNGKILIDVSNPLDFSKGMPPTLAVVNTDSLGEQIQRTFPKLKVVKTLNTMNCQIMVRPSLVSGRHHVFMSGNEASAKESVKEILRSFGWSDSGMIDLGDITTARGTEMMLPIWIRLWSALGSADFNFAIVR